MMLTVTLNPALDLTYAIDALVPHATHRVAAVTERPGGKGVNVAAVLHALGCPVLATGLIGGASGDRVAELLAREGIATSFRRIAGETRRTVAVADGLDATGFWEPGPVVTPAEWHDFVAHYGALLPDAQVVVLSGSLPRGIPENGYATLIALAAEAGIPTVLDTSGPPLRLGAAANPDVIKPNTTELSTSPHELPTGPPQHPTQTSNSGSPEVHPGLKYPAALPLADQPAAASGGAATPRGPGRSPDSGSAERHPDAEYRAGLPLPHHRGGEAAEQSADGRHPSGSSERHRDGGYRAGLPLRDGAFEAEEWVGARRLRELGARAVVVSRGALGLLAVTPDGEFVAAPPEVLAGNPTGAGDACVAALARGLAARTPWADILTDAAALAAAAVLAPHAGAFDMDAYRRWTEPAPRTRDTR